jgi:hypothetical protein
VELTGVRQIGLLKIATRVQFCSQCSQIKSDYDGAWKNLVENRLREVLGLYFPQVEKEIDWQVAPKLLSQELKTFGIQEESLRGQRVDFLIEVVTLRGAKKVIFLHLEVQSRKERDFARRIYRYYQTIGSQTRRAVVTFVPTCRNWR